MDFSPIPALSAPVNLIKTTEKSTAEENHNIKLGMKLNSSLKPGNYENKLIVSVVSNPYTPKAIMTEGPDFNGKLRSLEATTDKIEHFKKSTVAPAASMNAVNIEDEDSDYEIKLWLDPAGKTAYYYTEPEKVYLNEDSIMMFYRSGSELGLINILDIDLSSFNTSQVTDMGNMFAGMTKITSLDVSNFDTSQVTNMGDMFSGMSNLASLNLSNFDTSKVINMSYMFNDMRSLTALDLSNFDTSKVTSMERMFSHMSSLTTLNLSNFNTSQVTDMKSMFLGTSNLTALDLSSFDTSQVTDMSSMFYLASSTDKLETIYVNNDFNTAKLTDFSGMFQNRYKLRGGNGSHLVDPATADKSWLRIDDPAHGRPGYFTRKP